MKIDQARCLVTGAASGIGLSLTRQLLRMGARVVLVDLHDEPGQTVLAELSKQYGPEAATFVRADVASPPQLEGAFATAKKEMGSIDFVCNNAGIGDEENWPSMVAINLNAVVHGTYLGMECMEKNAANQDGTKGCVVNVASLGGLYPMPLAPVYSATKHAVVGFTRSLEHMAGEGVRINCICPSFAQTPLVANAMQNDAFAAAVHAMGMLTPELVADGIIRLVEDESQAGAVMRVTPHKGIQVLDMAPGASSSLSKL